MEHAATDGHKQGQEARIIGECRAGPDGMVCVGSNWGRLLRLLRCTGDATLPVYPAPRWSAAVSPSTISSMHPIYPNPELREAGFRCQRHDKPRYHETCAFGGPFIISRKMKSSSFHLPSVSPSPRACAGPRRSPGRRDNRAGRMRRTILVSCPCVQAVLHTIVVPFQC
jgi:hypothetical protein